MVNRLLAERWVSVLFSAVPRVPTALAGEGLLGAHRRGSSVSDGLQRRLWRRVLSVAVRANIVSSCSLSELRAVFCKSSGSMGGGATLGVPGEGSERSGRYSWYQSEESAEI
ncbi:hypothetical protein Taro_041122, partial [Colocasia esculenta]|nr:hypothetical protein [Colocasia esculenta]